jgi:sugar (pentulose or hexulose) kinase
VTTDLLLGLDAGTTSCKAAVVTLEGEEIAHGQAPLEWTAVPTGAEIDPARFIEYALAAAHEALAAGAGGGEFRIVGLGVSSIAETGVLLDRHGEPVTAAIAWHDSRGEEEAARLIEDIGRERFAATTGLSSRALRSVSKYRWLRDHVEATERGVRWLSVGEWIVHGLGGEQGAELSLASRTGWLDLHSRTWWDETLEWSGAPAGLLPEPAAAGTPLGRVGAAGPEAARGAVLAVGGHDHLSAAVGAGAVGEGEVLDSWGTAEAFVRAVAPLDRERVAQAVDDEIMVGWHAVPDRQNLLGAMRSGAALGRVLALLGVTREGRDELERAALEVDAEAGGIELRGLNDYRVELVNIGADPYPALVWRAALESCGRGARDLLDRMERVAGPHRRVVMAGGWSEGVAARAVKEAHIGPFERSEAVFMGARGAALTAGRAAGLV